MRLWRIVLRDSSRWHTCNELGEAIVVADSATEAYDVLEAEMRQDWQPLDKPPSGMRERNAYDILEMTPIAGPAVLLTREESC